MDKFNTMFRHLWTDGAWIVEELPASDPICVCPEHIDFLDKQGTCRRKQTVFLPDQNAAGTVFRTDRKKFQPGTAVNCQSTVQTERTTHSFFHQQHRIERSV